MLLYPQEPNPDTCRGQSPSAGLDLRSAAGAGSNRIHSTPPVPELAEGAAQAPQSVPRAAVHGPSYPARSASELECRSAWRPPRSRAAGGMLTIVHATLGADWRLRRGWLRGK